MITGVTLLMHPIISLREFFIKRFLKVVLPAFFWFIIYYYMHLLNYVPAFDFSKLLKSINIFYYFVYSPSYHLPFIYLILSLYIALPILQPLYNTIKDTNLIKYSLGCTISYYFIINILEIANLFKSSAIFLQIPTIFSHYAVFYAFLGAYLFNKSFSISRYIY